MNTWYKLRDKMQGCLDDMAESEVFSPSEIKTIYHMVDIVKDLDEILMGEEYSGRKSQDTEKRRRVKNGITYLESDTREKLEQLMEEAHSEAEREAIQKCLESI